MRTDGASAQDTLITEAGAEIEDGDSPDVKDDADDLSRADENEEAGEEDEAKKKEELEKDGYKVQDYKEEARLSNNASQELIINIEVDPPKEGEEGASPGLRKTVNFDNSIEQIDGEQELGAEDLGPGEDA
jgi:hypothetical protein